MRARKFWYHVHYHFTFNNGQAATGTGTYTVKYKKMTERTLAKLNEVIKDSIEQQLHRNVKSLTISSYTLIRESRG
ncbi:hypothetical protein [Bacillus phage SWEP1]|nr:hypothetical protein [Bacillus phage SWEP1]